MDSASLEGGFSQAPQQSAESFRKIMNVMARPGLIEELSVAAPPKPLSKAAGSLILTLLDSQTPVYLAGKYDCDQVRDWITFHCNAPLSGPADCMFAVGEWCDLAPIDQYLVGTPEYPDRSATLIVECEQIGNDGYELSGPGIKETHSLSLPEENAFVENAKLFPLGMDFYFTSTNKIAALPRTTKIRMKVEGA